MKVGQSLLLSPPCPALIPELERRIVFLSSLDGLVYDGV